MALALSFPSIGYYTAAMYVSYMEVQGSEAGIAIRAIALLVTGAAFLAGWRYRTLLPARTLPGLLFLLIYLLRMTENVWLHDLEIYPDTRKAFTIFIFSSIMTLLMLSCVWRGLSMRDARITLSCLAILFTVFAFLTIDSPFNIISGTGRLGFIKVNPISLAYTCSSFMFYYLLIAQRSWRAAIEAMVFVPFLVIIAAQAQSRGMLLSCFACLFIYIAALRGWGRLAMLFAMGLLVVLTAVVVDREYFEMALQALQRIDPVNDQSTSERVFYWRTGFEQFLADPFFGRYIGIGTTYTEYPHNIYLESLMAVGLIGAIPFVLHLAFASYAAFAILRLNSTNWVWTLIALLFFRDAIGAAASGAIWGSNGFWITSFLVIAIWQGQQRDIKPASLLQYAKDRPRGIQIDSSRSLTHLR